LTNEKEGMDERIGYHKQAVTLKGKAKEINIKNGKV
jgi:hypothetical protein